MSAAAVKFSRLTDVSEPALGVCVIRLGDGATMRATVEVVTELTRRPIAERIVAYTVDDAGNRYNARRATEDDLRHVRLVDHTPRRVAECVERCPHSVAMTDACGLCRRAVTS